MALIDGDEFVSGDILSYQQGNRLKDNWVQADPQANLGSPQQGMIVQDSDDERLYLRRASDYAPIWTPDAPFPWTNLITNSGFGVWSQSDANKGIATLVYDNLAGGNFGVGDTITGATSGAVGKVMTDNGATSMTIGATSGTFQDNEQIGNGAGVTADVDGDTDIGVKNDPMNNDSTGDWTDDGANITLADNVGEYTVTTNAATQRAWIANAALTAGKIYKIELDIKDGSTGGEDIEGYFDDGAAQYGMIKVTAAGWASVFWVFECATTTAAGLVGFRIPTSLGGNNIEIRRFSCYEITPGCTAADTVAMDGWIKDSTVDIYREHSGANVQDGSFYANKLVVAAAADYVRFPGAFFDNEEWYMQFRGKTVTWGKWVLTSTASHARLAITDSAGTTYSSYHTGGGAYEWLEVTRVINAGATSVAFYVYGDAAPNVNGDTIIYHCQGMLIFGDAIGEGNYQPRLGEIIWTKQRVNSNTLAGEANLSDLIFTALNLEADTDGKLPKGTKAVWIYSDINDSGSAGVDCYLYLRANVAQGWQYLVSAFGLTNDASRRQTGWQACNPDGDFEYSIEATGANTFDIPYFRYQGVQVT